MADRRVVVDLVMATGQYGAGARSAIGVTNTLGRAVTGVGVAVGGLGALATAGFAAVAAGAIKVGTSSVAAFRPVETALSRIVGLVGVNQDLVDDWGRQLSTDLPAAVGRGPRELAEALFFITSSGQDGAEAMDTLRESAKGATAGLGETALVADVTTSAMNAYGIANLSAAKALDIVVATAREGKAEAPELAGSLGRVIPIAAQMKVEFEEVGAAIAIMTRSGLNADEAATALRGALNSLLDPSKQAQKALKSIGFEAEDFRTMLADEGLLVALRTLEDRFDGNTEKMAEVFGNVRALTGVLAILNTEAAVTDEVFAGVANSAGSLDAAFKASTDRAGFSFEQFAAEMEAQLVQVGEQILPRLAASLDENKDSIFALIEALGDLAIAATDVATAMAGPTATAVDFLAESWDRHEIGLLRVKETTQDVLNWLARHSGFSDPTLPQYDFGSVFTEAEAEALALGEAFRWLDNAIREGMDPVEGMGTALAVLASSGELTMRKTQALRDEYGMTNAEMGKAVLTALEWAVATDLAGNGLAVLSGDLRFFMDALREEQFQLDIAAEAQHDYARFTGIAAQATRDQTDDWLASLDPLQRYKNALFDAADGQETLTGAILAAADPAFGAIKAYQRYQETLADVDDDGKRTKEELLRLAESILGTQAAFEAVNSEDVTAAVMALQTALGLSDDEARDLLTSLGLLDGLEVNSVVNTDFIITEIFDKKFQTSGAPPVLGPTTGPTVVSPGSAPPAPKFVPKADGGRFLAGQTLFVGEKGTELVQFPMAGNIVPNHRIGTSMSAATAGAGVTIQLNVTGNTFGSTKEDAIAGMQEAIIRSDIARLVTFNGAGR